METRTDDGRTARRWTRREFERLYERGVLGSDDRVELIEGELLVVSPEGPYHSASLGEAHRALIRAFGKRYAVRPQNPLTIDEYSLPEPDLLVVPGRPMDYRDEHPGPSVAVLCVEIANSSREFDLGRKLRLYARAGVPEYWVVDLLEQCIHVHRLPARSGYRKSFLRTRGASIRPLRAARSVRVDDILGT